MPIICPDSPANNSTCAVRGVDQAIGRSWHRHHYERSPPAINRAEEADRYRSRLAYSRSFDRDSIDYDNHSYSSGPSRYNTTDNNKTKPRSPSPSSVVQAFRTRKRVSRNLSKTEPAEVSRPEPLREDSATKLKDIASSRPAATPATTTSSTPTAYIEIEPGVKAPLRRTEETLQAIGRNAFVTTSCFGCEAKLYCINDAKFMICPHCRVVSPLFLDNGHGVGLGFTHQTLLATTTTITPARKRS